MTEVTFTREAKLKLNGEVFEFQDGDKHDLHPDTAEALHARGVVKIAGKKAVKQRRDFNQKAPETKVL